MRIGHLDEPGKANSNYRRAIPLHALEQRGHVIVGPAAPEGDTPMRELVRCDLVHCFRREERFQDLASLSRRGVAINFDNDDDLSASDMLSGKSSLAALRLNRKRSAMFTKVAQLADLVTTPSQLLAEHYRSIGAERVTVIENYLDRGVPHFGSRERHDGIVVGWIAGLEHAPDAEPMGIADIFARLLDAHPNLRVLTAGVHVPLRSERYEYIQNINHFDLLGTIARIDIGIAPLVDNAFNRARSNVKLKEYGAGGAAWLASPVGPYRGLGSAEGGELVADGDWYEAIDRLLRSGFARKKLARRALKWAKGQTIDRHVQIWESEFEAAIERAAARMASSRTAASAAKR